MNRNGVSYKSGSVNLTLRSSWIFRVEARETSFIKSWPTPEQSLPSFALYRTRPMKNVAFLSSAACAKAAWVKPTKRRRQSNVTRDARYAMRDRKNAGFIVVDYGY